MATRYQVRLYDTAGDLVAVFDDEGGYRSLTISKALSNRGFWQFIISDEDDRKDLFELDGLIEVLRKNDDAGLDWSQEFVGLWRTPERSHPESDVLSFRAHGFSLEDFLARRIIAYKSGTVQAAKDGFADDIMKEYVNENLGAAATVANDRLAEGVMTGFSVQADASAAGTWDGAKAYQNLLEVLKSISEQSNVEFGVVWDGAGTATFQFQTSYPLWGTDRSTVGLNTSTGLNGAGNKPVIFSVVNLTMLSPTYVLNRGSEMNRIFALGQGQGAGRNVEVVEDAALQGESPWNLREGASYQNNLTVSSSLVDAGNRALEEARPRARLSFEVLQQPSQFYGKHYFLGDKITARFVDIEKHYIIVGMLLGSTGGQETDEQVAVRLREAQ